MCEVIYCRIKKIVYEVLAKPRVYSLTQWFEPSISKSPHISSVCSYIPARSLTHTLSPPFHCFCPGLLYDLSVYSLLRMDIIGSINKYKVQSCTNIRKYCRNRNAGLYQMKVLRKGKETKELDYIGSICK